MANKVFSLTVFFGLPWLKENNSYIFHFFPLQTNASSGHLVFWELRVKVRCLRRNEMIYKARQGVSRRTVDVKTFTKIFFICHPCVSLTMLSLEKSLARTYTHILTTLYMYTHFSFCFVLFFFFFITHWCWLVICCHIQAHGH